MLEDNEWGSRSQSRVFAEGLQAKVLLGVYSHLYPASLHGPQEKLSYHPHFLIPIPGLG